jgi:hypothetical protein
MASPQCVLSASPNIKVRARRRRPRLLWWWAGIAFFAGGLLWYFTLGSENQGNTDQHRQSSSDAVASIVRPIGNQGVTENG